MGPYFFKINLKVSDTYACMYTGRILPWSTGQVLLLFFKKYGLYFLINFLNILATLHSMWDLISPTRDQTCTPCTESMES